MHGVSVRIKELGSSRCHYNPTVTMSLLGFFLTFLHSQFFVTPPYPENSFEGKTVIVTGSNIGLGLEAARHITRLGAQKVILAVRSVEKGEQAKKSIEETTKRTGVVEVWQLDLTSYASVKSFSERASSLPRLDVLLENAAIQTSKFSLAEENEATITTNVVSTFLLALLLLPKLKETAKLHDTKPHLVIVSSEVHFLTNLPERQEPSIFDALNDKQKARMSYRYNVSKLLEVFTVRQIVAEYCPDISKYPVVINLINPGFCHSNLLREVGPSQLIFKWIIRARTTEVGSRTLVDAACKGPESHGKYLADCEIRDPAPFVMSSEGSKTQKRVWKELSEKLEHIQPGILDGI
jgi:NAD(P)-dependent dehydrogenase (short-subunit alcohol dehydrogenase family)